MIKLPGLIDPHVHLRYLDSHKEDFVTGSQAALAGGFTTIIDMPNNNPPITTLERLQDKIKQAKQETNYPIGFHFGSLGDNLDEFAKVKDLVYGLKLYLNITTGGYIINEETMRNIYRKWNEATQGKKPILLHAEADVMDSVIKVVRETKQPTHICHVSSQKELEAIMQLKGENLPITCGVTPHHLFLIDEDVKTLGPLAMMKPPLKPKSDQDFLWKNFKHIDIIESDHAPHTLAEKMANPAPFGVPGLETTLPLLLNAMNEKKIKLEEIIDKCYTQPKAIFHIPDQEETYVEVDENEFWTIKNENLHTKCKWSPFAGWKIKGRIKRVVLRGKTVFPFS